MRIVTLAMVGGLLLAGNSSAFAQDGEDGADAAAATATEGEAAADGEAAEGEAAKEGSGQSYAGTEARFPIRRGFFAEGDFGVFMTIGGRNTNNPALPGRGISNMQPYLGVMAGYDLMSDEVMNIAAGLKIAVLLNGSAGRVTADEAVNMPNGDPGTQPNDYEVWQIGVGGAFDYLLTDRLGLSFKLDGGLAILNANPFQPANTLGGGAAGALDPRFADAGKATMGGIVSVGAGVSYATLLTGFTVGLDLRFSAILSSSMIPALSATIPIKYNF